MWNQKAFNIIAGVAVFIAVTLLIEDAYAPLAYAILIAAFGYLLLSNEPKIASLLGNFKSSLGKA